MAKEVVVNRGVVEMAKLEEVEKVVEAVEAIVEAEAGLAELAAAVEVSEEY